jgi:hypothetical protein
LASAAVAVARPGVGSALLEPVLKGESSERRPRGPRDSAGPADLGGAPRRHFVHAGRATGALTGLPGPTGGGQQSARPGLGHEAESLLSSISNTRGIGYAPIDDIFEINPCRNTIHTGEYTRGAFNNLAQKLKKDVHTCRQSTPYHAIVVL